jgi:cytochrome c biogenesis protein CcmG, thiol:disulfide interchange protein DsbE
LYVTMSKISPVTALRCGVLLAAVLAAGCGPEPRTYRPLAAGDAAPAFAAPVLGADTLDLRSLRGHVVLLNVWATWCPPCREEMPYLQQVHERFAARGLRVVGVSIDARGSEGAIHQFLGDIGVTFTILHDAADVFSREFRTIGVPETFLIDREGRIRRRWIGKFDPLAADALRDIEAALE